MIEEGVNLIRRDTIGLTLVALRRAGLRWVNLPQPIIRKMADHMRSGAMPEEAAILERVSETSFWKAFGEGVRAPFNSAKRDLFCMATWRLAKYAV